MWHELMLFILVLFCPVFFGPVFNPGPCFSPQKKQPSAPT